MLQKSGPLFERGAPGTFEQAVAACISLEQEVPAISGDKTLKILQTCGTGTDPHPGNTDKIHACSAGGLLFSEVVGSLLN